LWARNIPVESEGLKWIYETYQEKRTTKLLVQWFWPYMVIFWQWRQQLQNTQGSLRTFRLTYEREIQIIGKTELNTNFPQGRWHWKIFPLQVATVGCPVGIMVALINDWSTMFD